MARSIDATFESEIDSDLLRPALLIKAEFDSGDVRAWTGAKEITFNSEGYVGLGEFLGISQVLETQKLQANSLQFTLTGIDSSLISIALNEQYQWRPITMWFAVMDDTFETVLSSYEVFSGRMDVMEINDDGQSSTIVLNAESSLIDLKESRERRYTPEDQKQDYPNDLGLDRVPLIQDLEINWGAGQT